ncbi:MAG: serine hydroxymethyltransferase, cytosolic [Parcubacteria group bacterium GW2011_GWC1_45_9]|nr:MAG: serine hydroxymethyltransferase, cytosolic [Parcubacteria group bacterium GW2011_GWC1_45_9]
MDKIFKLIKKEELRQKQTLMMIPSENYAWPEVRRAVGSILMHKYAEGQPGRRYYQGNQFVDEIEFLCQERALQAFKLSPKKWSANVQPHSGCPANLAVYHAMLEPGQKIMSMFLPDGGHLSHGWHTKDKKITLVSKIWRVEFYKVDSKTRVFDYRQLEKQAKKFRPKILVSGGTAYPGEINHKRMASIAKKAGAWYLADISHEAGLVIGGANKTPFPFADFVTFTTHKTLRGPRGAVIISRKEYEEKINASVFPGLQGGPHLHSIAGIAIALAKAKTKSFKNYARQVVKNAKLLAKLLKVGGLDVVSDSTQKHLILIDLQSRGTNGWVAANALEAVGIITNRNTVPNETASAFYPSGLRLGTPAITVRGMKEKEIKGIAAWILSVIAHVRDEKLPADVKTRAIFIKSFKDRIAKDKFLLKTKRQVKALTSKFPTPS